MIRSIIYQSVVTASVVALLFLAIGIAVFKLLDITIADFMVAGGILLFVISISDLMTTEKKNRDGWTPKAWGPSLWACL